MGEDKEFGFGYCKLVLSVRNLYGVEEIGMGWRHKWETRRVLIPRWESG